jgi:hypothetical protein
VRLITGGLHSSASTEKNKGERVRERERGEGAVAGIMLTNEIRDYLEIGYSYIGRALKLGGGRGRYTHLLYP